MINYKNNAIIFVQFDNYFEFIQLREMRNHS